MQFKLTTLVCLTISSLAAATPLVARTGGEGTNQCNTGEIQCCNSVESAHSAAATAALQKVGVVIGADVDSQIGITCSPINLAAVGGNSCSAQPVCCQNNNFNGVVAIGCTPININL